MVTVIVGALLLSGIGARAQVPTGVESPEQPPCAFVAEGCSPPYIVLPHLGARVGSLGQSEVYLTDRAAYVVDLETLKTRRVPAEPYMALWDSLNIPYREFGVAAADSMLWAWDRSIGSVMRLSLGMRSGQWAWPRRSWYAHFTHAPGIRQATGRPLAFGGYGLYRAKDFLLEFDPDRDSWTELPNVQPGHGPGPRIGSGLITGWDPRRVLLVGGRTTNPGVAPPDYSLQPRDAWSYDPADSSWTRIDIDPSHATSLEDQLRAGHRVDMDLQRNAVFYLSGLGNSSGSVPDQVIQWNPLVGRMDVLGTVPREHPFGFVPVGVYLSTARDTITAMYWQPNSTVPPADWPVYRYRFAVAADLVASDSLWIVDSAWPAGLALVLAVGALLAIRRRRSVGPDKETHTVVTVTLGSDGSAPVVSTGRLRSASIPPMAGELLAHAAQRAMTKGGILDGEEIADLFVARYRDPDSARVAKNRVIDQLNEVFLDAHGHPLLERVPDAFDRRRMNYRLEAAIRLDPSFRASTTESPGTAQGP